jgi:hypothetical protein
MVPGAKLEKDKRTGSVMNIAKKAKFHPELMTAWCNERL